MRGVAIIDYLRQRAFFFRIVRISLYFLACLPCIGEHSDLRHFVNVFGINHFAEIAVRVQLIARRSPAVSS
jgi:hypothetical protein